VTGYFLAGMQLHACRFRLTKKNTHTEFMLRCSIFNFLTVFGIKITKSPRTPKRNIADIYRQILTGCSIGTIYRRYIHGKY
jgi:hypothetical protein